MKNKLLLSLFVGVTVSIVGNIYEIPLILQILMSFIGGFIIDESS